MTGPCSDAPVHLRGITWDHPRGYDCLVAAARHYEQNHPGVRITWHARSLQAFADAPVADLASAYDLLVVDHPHVPLAIADLAALDGADHDDELAVLAAQSVGSSHVSYGHGGHQYALACDAAAQVAVHRPDVMTNLPHTWDDVLDVAADGRVLWPAKPIDAFSSLVSVAAAAGAVPDGPPGTFLEESILLSALRTLHILAERVPDACLAWNPIQAAEALAQSARAAYIPLAFGYTNYARAGFRAHRLAYSDAPRGGAGVPGSLLGGAGIAMSARSRCAAQARDFAFWVASASVQAGVYFDAGGQPGNAAAWDDDRLNDETLDFFHHTRSTLEHAVVRPRRRGFIAFQDRVSPWVTAVLSGAMTDRRFIAGVAAAAEELLAD